MNKKVITVILLCMMFTLTACSISITESNDTNETDTDNTGIAVENIELAEGDEAPDIEFQLMDGTTAKLSDYSGKPVVINFWATGCGYCVDEMPAFEKLKETYGDDITIIALNCGGDSEDDINEFIDYSGYTFNVGTVSDKEANKYEIQSIPATFIIDKDGVISYKQIGAYGAETMYDKYYNPEIKKLLDK